jgi:hypothetical protein
MAAGVLGVSWESYGISMAWSQPRALRVSLGRICALVVGASQSDSDHNHSEP